MRIGVQGCEYFAKAKIITTINVQFRGQNMKELRRCLCEETTLPDIVKRESTVISVKPKINTTALCDEAKRNKIKISKN